MAPSLYIYNNQGQLIQLNQQQQKLLEAMMERSGRLKGQQEKDRSKSFLQNYEQNYGGTALPPEIRNLGLKIGAELLRAFNKEDRTALQHKLADKRMSELFFRGLVGILRQVAAQPQVEPAVSFSAAVNSWKRETVQGNKLETLDADYFSRVYLALQDGLIKGKMLDDIRRNPNIINVSYMIGEQTLNYLQMENPELMLNNVPVASNFYAIDGEVMTSVLQGIHLSEATGGAQGPSGWQRIKEDGLATLDGRVTDMDSFTSHYSLLWQHPGAVVNLYFAQQIPAYAQALSQKDGRATIKTNITAADIRLLALWHDKTKGESDKAKELTALAKSMESAGFSFDESIFADGARIDEGTLAKRLAAKGITDPAKAAQITDNLRKGSQYLQGWFDNIARISQPYSGVMYQRMLDETLKKSVGKHYANELIEALSSIPAPAMKRRMQMIEGDKILALKEQFFGEEVGRLRRGEAAQPGDHSAAYLQGFQLDGDFVTKMTQQYGFLFGGSFAEAIFTGEFAEQIKGADNQPIASYAKFLQSYAQRMKAENKNISLAFEANDTAEDRAAKLILQGALTLWKNGASGQTNDYLGYVTREAKDAAHMTIGGLMGMSDSQTDYLLRFRGTLVRWGYGYQGNQDFTLAASNKEITQSQIRFAGAKFREIWNDLGTRDPKGREDMAKSLIKDPPADKTREQVIEYYITLMENASGNVTNLSYASENNSPLEGALVFFTRNIAPQLAPAAEGEASSNIIDLPLQMFRLTQNIDIKNIEFGSSAGATPSETVPVDSPSITLPTSTGRAFGTALRGVGEFGAKSINLGILMHPTIQLSLQGALLRTAVDYMRSGNEEMALESLKEWGKSRLNFFAFQYNPFALAHNAASNAEQGNTIGALAEGTFAFHAVRNLSQTRGIPVLIAGYLGYSSVKDIMDKKYVKGAAEATAAVILLLQQYRFLKNIVGEKGWKGLFQKLENSAINQVLRNKEYFPDGLPPAELKKMRVTLKRVASNVKDLAIEPFMKSIQMIERRFGEMPVFWKNLSHFARNPNAIFEVEVPLPNGQTTTIKAKGWHLVDLYSRSMDNSLLRRGAQTASPFFDLGQGIYDRAAGTRHQGLDQKILSWELRGVRQELIALNGNNEGLVDHGMAIMQQESQAVRHEGVKAGGRFRVGLDWATRRVFASDGERFMMRDIFHSMDRSGVEHLAGRHLAEKLLRSGEFGKTDFASAKSIYREMVKHGGLELFPENPRANLQKMAQQQFNVLLDNVVDFAIQNLSPEDRAAYEKTGVLTDQQFNRSVQANKTALTEIIGRVNQEFSGRIGERIAAAKKGPVISSEPALPSATRGLPETSEVVRDDALARRDQPVEETGSARKPRVIIDAEFAEPVVPPPPFELNAALRETGMNVEVNGALDNLPLETQRQFVDAVRQAKERGMEKLTIRPEVKFAGGGEGALQNLSRVLTGENVPRTLEVIVHNNQVNFKGPNVSIPGTLMIIPLQSEMAAGLNGSGSLDHPAVDPRKPLTVDQIAERFNIPKPEAKLIAADASRLRADNEVAKQKAMAKVQGNDPAAVTKRATIAENFDLELRDAEGTAREMRTILGEGAKISGEVRSTVKVIDGLHTELISARRAGNTQEATRLEGEINAKATQLEKLTNPLTRRVNRFAGEHGPTMVILLGVELGMALYHGQIKSAKDVALHGGMTVATYLAFMGGEKGLTAILDMAKGKAGPLTGAAMGVALAVMRHNKSLVSSNAGARTAAIADVVKEGLAGYWATKAGAAAAAPLAENPVLAAVVGVGVGMVVYGGIAYGGEIFGYDKWLNRQTTAGEISDSFEQLTRTMGWQLNVRSGSIDSPFFNNLTEPVQTAEGVVMASKAQTFLGILQAAENFRAMSPADREKFIRENGAVGQNIANTFQAMRQLDSFEVGSYDDLAPETMDKVAEAITTYRRENNLNDSTTMVNGRPQRVEHRFNIKLTRRTEPVLNPLTGETAGQRTFYDINVSATRYNSTATTERSLAVQTLGQRRTVTRMAAGQTFPVKTFSLGGIEGNPDKLSTAVLLAQAEQVNEGGLNTFNLTMQQLIDNDISLPLANIDRFPLVKREMATHLAHLGYTVYNQSGGVETGLLLSSYLQFSRESGNPIEIQVPRNLELMPGFGTLPTTQPNSLSFPVTNPAQPIISLNGQFNPGLLRAGQELIGNRQPSRIMLNNTMRSIGNQLNPSAPLNLPIASSLGTTTNINLEVATMKALVHRDS